MQKLLTRGNAKLDKSIFNWSITPIESCLNCQDCKDTCYAMQSYKQYPVVKIAWGRNFELAKSGMFIHNIIHQLKGARTCKFVRIHVAGDFFSQDYIDQWENLVKLFPSIKFYTYTKVYHLFDFSKIEALDNFNMINSVAPDGGINYGDMVRIKELSKMGYKACPVTLGRKDITCGRGCELCISSKKVCFVIH